MARSCEWKLIEYDLDERGTATLTHEREIAGTTERRHTYRDENVPTTKRSAWAHDFLVRSARDGRDKASMMFDALFVNMMRAY